MASAICAALYARTQNGGLGTHVDIAMLDVMVTILEKSLIAWTSMKEKTGGRFLSLDIRWVFYQRYKEEDVMFGKMLWEIHIDDFISTLHLNSRRIKG